MPRQLTPRGASGKLVPILKLGAARPGDGAGSSGMESGRDDRQAAADRQGRRGKRKPKRPDRASLAAAALAYLARFAASSEMLRRVLMRRVDKAARAGLIDRAEGAALVAEVVARVTRSQLIDDESFALQRARGLL